MAGWARRRLPGGGDRVSLRLEDFEPGHVAPMPAAVPTDVLDRLASFGVSLVASELGPTLTRHLAIDTATLPRISGAGAVAGVAVTVASPPGSTASLLPAIDATRPGDALIVVSDQQTATWGELTGQLAYSHGVRCVIVDGVARDVARLRAIGISVWARRVYVGERANSSIQGQVNVPVNLAGVQVRAGDVVLADDDGIVCIPREQLDEVLARAVDRYEREQVILESARAGTVSPSWKAWGEGQGRPGAPAKTQTTG